MQNWQELSIFESLYFSSGHEFRKKFITSLSILWHNKV